MLKLQLQRQWQLYLQPQVQLQLHYIYTTLHCTTPTRHYATLHYVTLHLLHYTAIHLHHTHYTTLHLLHYTALQLHYNYTTLHYTALHCTTLVTSSSCGWGDHCNHSKKHNSFRSISGFTLPSIITTYPFYSFLSLELPPPPCAVLLE